MRSVSRLTPAAAALVSLTACEDPIVLGPGAGSFALPNACGAVAAKPDGDLYVWSRPSSSTVRVDSRSPSGALKWSVTLPSADASCTGSVDPTGSLAAATTDSIFFLDGTTGAIKWRFAAKLARLASTNARLYVTTSAFSNTPSYLLALNSASGQVVWSRIADNGGAPYLSEPTATLYNVRRVGALAVDPSTGMPKWDTPIAGSSNGFDAALASDGTLVVSAAADFSSTIAAYALDGRRKWTASSFGARVPASSPIIDEARTVYSAHQQNQFGSGVYALSFDTGDPKWNSDFDRIESDLVVGAEHTVYVIARASPDSAYNVYGIRDGAIVSSTPARGITISTQHPLMLHRNGLLYYVGTNEVVFTPTTGYNPAAEWPMDKRDQERSSRKASLPD